jgi:hypothetical protein
LGRSATAESSSNSPRLNPDSFGIGLSLPAEQFRVVVESALSDGAHNMAREKTCSPRTGGGRRAEGRSGSGLWPSSGAERGQGEEPFTDAQVGVEPSAPRRFLLSNLSLALHEQTFDRVSEGDLKGYSPPPRGFIVGPELWLPAA